jgi:hypothetical protein
MKDYPSFAKYNLSILRVLVKNILRFLKFLLNADLLRGYSVRNLDSILAVGKAVRSRRRRIELLWHQHAVTTTTSTVTGMAPHPSHLLIPYRFSPTKGTAA